MTPPLLRAERLHKSYGAKRALDDVSLTLEAGELVVLLGPNGAGKSTLMQLLTGLFSPDQGSVEVLGHDMRSHASRALAGLGVVFQQTALDLDLSVMANLLFHTDLHGLPRGEARERIGDGLRRLGLDTQAGAVVRSLSGGTRRKVELTTAGKAFLERIEPLLRGQADFWMASRQVQDSDLERARARNITVPTMQQFTAPGSGENIIGLDALAIVVNGRNPVKRLTFAQKLGRKQDSGLGVSLA